ncbi:hypothetical protein CC1G_05116 [Coprinopsis cinerea okayama7|uniref:Uncharacterized protein n=1 Tax=Coprinopsis cinerea (strain Okayama-7 / 130 / ATCC MYA-4618 / FGSC 9003) TaxID=240176 RepID=A8NFX1_COPC7|nr:hypothetical protein CC1G_05116 [Coprinopsis cinerea okayama7\|eukprot:XP_001833416.2 hypothetical protein CC1G_05116 [Coprinopsis cinerea okayama7\
MTAAAIMTGIGHGILCDVGSWIGTGTGTRGMEVVTRTIEEIDRPRDVALHRDGMAVIPHEGVQDPGHALLAAVHDLQALGAVRLLGRHLEEVITHDDLSGLAPPHLSDEEAGLAHHEPGRLYGDGRARGHAQGAPTEDLDRLRLLQGLFAWVTIPLAVPDMYRLDLTKKRGVLLNRKVDSDKKPQEPVVNVEATQDAVMKEEEVPQDSPQSPSPPPADDAKMEEDPPTAPQVGEVVAASDPPQKQRSTTPAPAPGPPRPSTTESAATSPCRLSAAETKSPMSRRQDRPSPIPPHVKAEEKLSLRSLKVDHAGLPPIPPPSASHRSPIHFKPTAHSPLATPKYEGQSPRSQHSQQSYQAPAASSHSREEHKRESSTPQSPDVVMADSTPHSQQTHDKSSHPIPPPPQRTGIPTGPRAHGYKDYSIPAGPAATHPRGHPPTGPAAQQPPSGPSNRLPTPQGTKGPNWSGGPGSNRHSSDTMVKTVQDKVDELCGVGRPRVANYPLASEIQTQVETRMLRETKYYETTSIAYPALWELELAMLDLHTSELRRKAASSQLDKAMFGALGIDYVSEGLTLSSSSALQAPPMVASTSTLSTS